MFSDNPVRDFERWDNMRAREENMLPRCVECGDPVSEYKELDGETYCLECYEDIKKDMEE